MYVISIVAAVCCWNVCEADRSGCLLLSERAECCRYNAKHMLLTQLASDRLFLSSFRLSLLLTGCLTNFLPFTMACDQMAVTLDKHMALRTEVAVPS